MRIYLRVETPRNRAADQLHVWAGRQPHIIYIYIYITPIDHLNAYSVQAKRAETSAEKESLLPGWNHVVCGGHVLRATTPTAPTPTPERVTENPWKEVAATRKKSKTSKSAPKVTVGPKQAPVAKSNKSAKHKQPSQSNELVAPIQPNHSPIEEISDLLDNLPLNGCVELTRRLLTSVPSLPCGPVRSRVVLKIVVLFVAEYGSTA